MTEEKNTERVTMEWPKDLKAQVRDKVGPRGLTEFTLDAVALHLQGGSDVALKAQERELNEAKEFIQLLADRLAMGGSPEDRLQAMMEIEFPFWVDTTGWPEPYAQLVKPEPIDLTPEPAPEPEMVEAPELTELMHHFGVEGTVKVPDGEPFDTRTAVVERTEPTAESDPAPSEPEADGWKPVLDGERNDLFAEIMRKTGGALDPALKDHLKPASEIPQPEPKPQEDRCTKCGDLLVDGECWNC